MEIQEKMPTRLSCHYKHHLIQFKHDLIQSNLHCIQSTRLFLSVHAFPGNRTRDLGVASTVPYSLNYMKAISKLSICVSWLELK